MRGIAALAFCVAAMIGCTSVAQDAGLAGSEWRPMRLGASEVPEKPEVFVQFKGADRLEGNGGCNRFFGSYSVSGNSIEIGALGATRMACPEPISGIERQLFEVLESAKTFNRKQGSLTLFDAKGTEIARLVQRDRD